MSTQKDTDQPTMKSSAVNQAIDRAFERTNKSTGASATEIFAAGMFSAIVGLVLNNSDAVAAPMRTLGCVMIAFGLVAMIGMSRKL